MTSEQIISFLKNNPALNHSQLEKEAGLPASTLNKATKGKLVLNQKNCSLLEPILRKYGFKNQATKAQVISVVNHKGGVAKTTTTINLGKALALLGKSVLLIDMDSQGNTTQCFNQFTFDKQIIHSLLENEPLPIIHLQDNLDLVPSDIKMSEREQELIAAVSANSRLAKRINTVRENYDYILIDCPPSLGILTENALVASDSCIIPFLPEASTYHGMKKLFEIIYSIREYSNPSLTVKGILFTMVKRNGRNIESAHQLMIEKIRAEYKHFRIFDAIIENATAVRQSQLAMQDLFMYAPTASPTQQYAALAQEIVSI